MIAGAATAKMGEQLVHMAEDLGIENEQLDMREAQLATGEDQLFILDRQLTGLTHGSGVADLYASLSE